MLFSNLKSEILSPSKFIQEKERREAKGKGEWEKIYQSEYRVPKNSKERQESLLKWIIQRNRGKQ